jgi:type I restriction enzyme S subunit
VSELLWPSATLGELTASTRPICYGVLKPGPYDNDGVPLLRVVDLADDRVDLSAAHAISQSLDFEFRRSKLRGGEVLLSIQGTVGRVAIAPPEAAGANISRTLAVIAPDERVDPRFLRYFLMSYRRRFKITGTTRASLNIGDLRSVRVPLPPLDEQLRIVALLEDHLSRLQAAIDYEKAARLRATRWERSALDAALTESAAASAPLRNLVVRVEAGKSFGGSAPPAREGEWGVVRVSAMTWGEFRPHENKLVSPERVDPRHEIRTGDVLVSRANTTDYVGAPVLVRETRPQLLLSDKSLRLVPVAGVDRAWLAEVLGTRGVRRQVSALATGTKDSMRNISQANLLSVSVPVSPRATQAQVVSACNEIRDDAVRLDAALSAVELRAHHLRRRLLAAAFSGDL